MVKFDKKHYYKVTKDGLEPTDQTLQIIKKENKKSRGTIKIIDDKKEFYHRRKVIETVLFDHYPDTLFIKMNKKNPSQNNNVQIIKVVSNSFNNKVELKIEKKADGKTKNKSTKCIKNMKFNWDFSGKTLLLDDYFEIPKKYEKTPRAIFLELKIPENMIINFDKNTEKSCYLSNETVPPYKIHFDKNHYYKVTKKGIQPTKETLKLEEKKK